MIFHSKKTLNLVKTWITRKHKMIKIKETFFSVSELGRTKVEKRGDVSLQDVKHTYVEEESSSHNMILMHISIDDEYKKYETNEKKCYFTCINKRRRRRRSRKKYLYAKSIYNDVYARDENICPL